MSVELRKEEGAKKRDITCPLCDTFPIYASYSQPSLRELIIETQRYDSSDVVFSMYLIIETKYICQK